MRVISGLEIFLENAHLFKKYKLGLLANQASVNANYQQAAVLIDRVLPKNLKVLFNPQHGWDGEKQDNMVESANSNLDKRLIFSLYGETRRPSAEMFSHIDILLVDLVDVGTRVYTFAQTLAYCLEEAAKCGVKVLVLDRPNPIGGTEVEGNILQSDLYTFVGLYPVPMRHGFTLGEYALFMNNQLKEPCDLEVITCKNWLREMYFKETKLPWVLPSPNMPSPEAAWVYPGQVLWEATNVSEGRGTVRPFNLVGAPFIEAKILFKELKKLNFEGLYFREAYFQPTFHKWAGEVCGGLELYPYEKTFKPYLFSLSLLEIILKYWPEKFKLKEPPYEYEYEKPAIDMILGDSNLYNSLLNGITAKQLEESWQEDLNKFLELREEYLIY